jgi:hypothetical protein
VAFHLGNDRVSPGLGSSVVETDLDAPGSEIICLSGSGIRGVCSIFLRVDRSRNEIHKPKAIFQ